MTFTQSVRRCLGQYVTFSGRASRPEFWWFILFVVLVQAVANAIDVTLFSTVTTVETGAGSTTRVVSNAPVSGLAALALLLPQLAAGWRRMHDTGRSGIFLLLPLLLSAAASLVLFFGIGLASQFQHGGSLDLLFTRATLLVVIPTLLVLLISPLLVIWWLTRPSQPGTNEYGPNPAEVTSQ